MRALPLSLSLSVLAACAAPGVELVPLDTDFAFVEIALRG